MHADGSDALHMKTQTESRWRCRWLQDTDPVIASVREPYICVRLARRAFKGRGPRQADHNSLLDPTKPRRQTQFLPSPPTWLAQEDGVVLGAAAQDLNHTRHLPLTANHLPQPQHIGWAARVQLMCWFLQLGLWLHVESQKQPMLKCNIQPMDPRVLRNVPERLKQIHNEG